MTPDEARTAVLAELDAGGVSDPVGALDRWVTSRAVQSLAAIVRTHGLATIATHVIAAELRRARRAQSSTPMCSSCDGAWRTDANARPLRKCFRITSERCPDVDAAASPNDAMPITEQEQPQP